MMINKRLINLCEDSKKYIIFTVLSSWIAILCNILIVFIISSFKCFNMFNWVIPE